jgi:hypothetical protein
MIYSNIRFFILGLQILFIWIPDYKSGIAGRQPSSIEKVRIWMDGIEGLEDCSISNLKRQMLD